MKEFLFAIAVMLLIPVYIVIKIFKNVFEICTEIFEPVVDGINVLTQDMFEFWKKIFKGEKIDMEDCLMIGIDISEKKDKNHITSCITICRREGRGYKIINQLFDKEAENIYYKLINKKKKETIDKVIEEITDGKITPNKARKQIGLEPIANLEITKKTENKDLYDQVKQLFKISDKAMNIYMCLKNRISISKFSKFNDFPKEKNILCIYKTREKLNRDLNELRGYAVIETNPTNIKVILEDGTNIIAKTIQECTELDGYRFDEIRFE